MPLEPGADAPGIPLHASFIGKPLVNHARPDDVTQGYAADWTIAQLREPAQNIADRIEEMMHETQVP